MRDSAPTQADKGAGLRDTTISSAGDAVGSGTFTPPSINLPQGGGALGGIGQKFAANQPWSVRPDPFSSYRAGFQVRTCCLCQRVLMFHQISNLPNEEKGYDGLCARPDSRIYTRRIRRTLRTLFTSGWWRSPNPDKSVKAIAAI
jgi:hypothetical protein